MRQTFKNKRSKESSEKHTTNILEDLSENHKDNQSKTPSNDQKSSRDLIPNIEMNEHWIEVPTNVMSELDIFCTWSY